MFPLSRPLPAITLPIYDWGSGKISLSEAPFAVESDETIGDALQNMADLLPTLSPHPRQPEVRAYAAQ
jgi:hypothetical protein